MTAASGVSGVSNWGKRQQSQETSFNSFISVTPCLKETHEKRLNIANLWRHANQSYTEISVSTSQNGHHPHLQTINAGQGVD